MTSKQKWFRRSFGAGMSGVAFGLLGLGACVWQPSKPQGGGEPRPVPSASGSGETEWGPAAAKAKANSELLAEMFRVVWGRFPADRSIFGSYVDTLNQGASVEGIYNGLVHSSSYRELEKANPGSTSSGLTIFLEELRAFQSEMKSPTRFVRTSASPLATPVFPDGLPPAAEEPAPVSEVDFPAKGATPSPRPSAPTELQPLFETASIYTLKRVLGDEALRLLDEWKDSPEKRAVWYGKWVARQAGRKVDFGLPLRNTADAGFHENWAKGATSDQLKWEVLNRIHRVLNATDPGRTTGEKR